MADPFWERKFRGENVSVALEDLTVQRMREIKSAFGDEYGIPQRFIALLLLGEADALSAGVQVSWARDGKKPFADLAQFDFNMSEFGEPDKPKAKPRKKPDPTRAGTLDETRLSETPTSSEDGSSSS